MTDNTQLNFLLNRFEAQTRTDKNTQTRTSDNTQLNFLLNRFEAQTRTDKNTQTRTSYVACCATVM